MNIIAINQINYNPYKYNYAQKPQESTYNSRAESPSFTSIFSRKKKIDTIADNRDYLTQEEFKAELKVLDKRIKSDKILSNNSDVNYIRKNLNKYNIKAFETYIDKGLYKKNSDNSLVKGIISDTNTPETASMTNKIVNDDDLLENDYLLSIYRVSMLDKNPEDGGSYKKFLDILFSDKALYGNKCIMSSLDTVAYLLLNKDNRKLAYNVVLQPDFAKKYLTTPGKFTISEDYIKNQHNLKISNDDNCDMRVVTFSMNGDNYDVISDESISRNPDTGDDISIKKDKDGNTYISVVKYDTYFVNFLPCKYPVTQKNTKYDMYGNRIYTEILQPQRKNSELYSGIVAKPHEKPIHSLDIKQNNDGITVQKKLCSAEEILTESYIDVDEVNDTSAFSYKIIAPDGKNLLSVERTFKKLDEKHYESSLNGKKYAMEYGDNELTIRTFDSDKEIKEDKILLKGKFDNRLEQLYKRLPGDCLLNLMKSDTSLLYNANKSGSGNYNDKTNIISVSGEYYDAPFVLMHEAGHAYDIKIGNLSKNNELKQIFDEELLKYKETSTVLEGEAIDYFTTLHHDNDDNCLTEVIAETYAIMSGFINNVEDDVKLRELVLAENFPRTVAFIANKIIENN